MLEKIFSWGKKKDTQEPSIRFGRYSDNNKPLEKTNKWGEADKLFKEKNYVQSIESFFDYLRDEAEDNVQLKREGNDFSFEICQGSKIIRGRGNGEELVAEINLARMPQTSVPVMRRLLEQNFVLYYSRYALDGDRLCMRFYTDIQTANPNKLYYALKELAIKADKQDDLLVQDFSSLEALDTDHIIPIATEEKEIKYQFLQKWIKETLEYIQTLDQEKFSGGISYLLLTLVYRIDYLITPESSLQSIVEKVHYTYFAKDEKPATEKNGMMTDALKSIQAMPKEELFKFLFKSKSTFAIVAPQTQKIIGESIGAANGNMAWYRDNNYHFIGKQICEYGISYAQYCYSLPSSLSQLFQLFMMVNYPDYFAALGWSETYADIIPDNTTVFKPHVNEIVERINTILSPWKTKYPKLEINAAQLKFDSIIHFNQSFTAAMETLNYDSI